MNSEKPLSLLKYYETASQESHLPAGIMNVTEFRERSESLITHFRQVLEENLTPEEFVLSSQCLVAIRLVESVLQNVRIPDENSCSTYTTPTATTNTLNSLTLLGIALKVLLYVGLVWAVISSSSILLILIVIGLCIFLDVATWFTIQHHRTPMQINSDRISPNITFDTDQLDLEIRQAVLQVDSILKQYSIKYAELVKLREEMKIRSNQVPIYESTRAFQRLVGLAQRQHPDLRELVLDQC